MGRRIVVRVADAIPVLFIMSILTFALVQLIPGDAVSGLFGAEVPDEAVAEQMRRDLGLDRSPPEQYARWLLRMLRGDLGLSLWAGSQPVTDRIRQAMLPTIELGFLAFAISLAIGLPVGFIAALRRGELLDTMLTSIAVAGFAVPTFFFGILLLLFFSVKLGWLPLYGYTSVFDDPGSGLRSLALPAFALGVNPAAAIARQTRSAMLEVLGQDYIRTARSKGLSEWSVLVRHALRNASLPIVTIIGFNVANIVGGSAIVEQMFAIPGMGRLAIESALTRDLPMIQGITLILGISVLMTNLIVDLLYPLLDPRIRYAG